MLVGRRLNYTMCVCLCACRRSHPWHSDCLGSQYEMDCIHQIICGLSPHFTAFFLLFVEDGEVRSEDEAVSLSEDEDRVPDERLRSLG